MRNADQISLEQATEAAQSAVYSFRLYISGITPKSTLATANIKKFCDAHLPGRYKLEIVDVYQQPELAKRDQIVAVPTLIKMGPLPVFRLVGAMTDENRVMRGLNLTA